MIFKKVLFFFSFLLQIQYSFCQDVNVSTGKIGPFYLGMNLADAEKALGAKITIKEVKKSADDYKFDINQIVQGVVIKIGFNEEYNDDPKTKKNYTITRVKSSDSKLKTKSGICIGLKREKVLEILDAQSIAYEYRKYPAYNEDPKALVILEEFFFIYDLKAGKQLIVNMQNGVVTGFELSYGEEE